MLSRLHTARVSYDEATNIAAAITLQPQVTAPPAPSAAQTTRVPLWQPAPVHLDEALYDRAVALVRREQSAETSLLRRSLCVSYADALSLLEQMSRDRIVSPADDNGQRIVLIGRAA
jgi:DNA segregation ATPase FtsK/SpoIIIE-like protein